jgi:SAM-dependent methyltransferase
MTESIADPRTSAAETTAETAAETAFDQYERRAWDGRADAYARSFAHLCAHTAPLLLDAAGVREGGAAAGLRVLDAGTGPGTVAAAAVARGARVTAVDAEPSMVARAAAALPDADVRHAMLPELPFADGEFDVVVSNFVVNHLGRPRDGVAELRRVLRPGGRIAVTIWSWPPEPGQALLGRALEAAGVSRPDTVPGLAADDDFPRTEEGLAALLGGAGLTDAACTPVRWDHLADPEVWWSGAAAGIAAAGQTLTAQPPAVIAEVRRHYDTLAAAFRRPDGLLALPHRALVATATAP